MRTVTAILIMAAILIGFNWPTPAHAETLRYVAGENVADIGDWDTDTITLDITWMNSQWPVAKVVKQLRTDTGLDIRTCKGTRNLPDYNVCGEVTISSDKSNNTGPTGKRLGKVSIWSTDNIIQSADISLDDKDGKKASANKRYERLYLYTIQAVGK